MSVERIVVAAVAVLAAIVSFRAALEHCGQSATGRYGVAAVAFTIAVLVLLGLIAPAIGYAIMCLSLVSIYVVDLVEEERGRRRRVASLAPRPRVDPVPAVWIVVAGLSALMVTPFALEEGHRVAASIVGVCVIAMAAIGYRIASAPLQLIGDDPEAERKADRASRARRTGLTSVLAVGIVFVFANLGNGVSGAETPVEHTIRFLALYVWVGLWLWEVLYVWDIIRLRAHSS